MGLHEWLKLIQKIYSYKNLKNGGTFQKVGFLGKIRNIWMLINFDVELSEFLLHITEMDLLSLLMTVKIIAVSNKRSVKFSDSRNIFYIHSSTVNREAMKKF